MPRPFTVFVVLMVLLVIGLAAAIVLRSGGWQLATGSAGVATQVEPAVGRGLAQRSGSVFTPLPPAPASPVAAPNRPLEAAQFSVDRVEVLDLGEAARGDAIWGASDRSVDRGDVLSQLAAVGQAAGPVGGRISQAKIHGRMLQADDGYLYFASMDERGERAEGSAPPRWGSQLWRVRSPWLSVGASVGRA